MIDLQLNLKCQGRGRLYTVYYMSGIPKLSISEVPEPLSTREVSTPLVDIKPLYSIQTEGYLIGGKMDFLTINEEGRFLIGTFPDDTLCIITLFDNGNVQGIYRQHYDNITPLYLFYKNGECKMRYLLKEIDKVVQVYYYENGYIEYSEGNHYTNGGTNIRDLYKMDNLAVDPNFYTSISPDDFQNYFK